MPFIELASGRFLFIHIPKTGGGTIECWLRSHANLYFHTNGAPAALRSTAQHLLSSDFRELFGSHYFDNMFTIVRNPYARIVSEYRMRVLLQRSGFFKDPPVFSQWLQKSLNQAEANPFYLDNHIRPQWNFIGDNVEIYHYEDGLQGAVRRISAIIDVDPPKRLPRIHNTSNKGIIVRLDLSDILLINNYYEDDFRLFGYDMYADIPSPTDIKDRYMAALLYPNEQPVEGHEK